MVTSQKKVKKFAVPLKVHLMLNTGAVLTGERGGWVAEESKEDVALSRGLKSLFLIHGVTATVIGILLYLMPVTWAGLTNYGALDQVFVRILGAFLVGLGFKDWLCFRAGCWKEVCIIVRMEIVLTFLAVLGGLFLLFFTGISSSVLAITILFGIFAAVWTYFYVTCR
jgi:hypothetical protein